MVRHPFLLVAVAFCMLAGCTQPPRKVRVIEYPTLDWTIDPRGFKDAGCVGQLPESCAALIALGCDEIRSPRFYSGGLQPPYAVMECIHAGDTPPDAAYFRQQAGLDTRYRSLVVFRDGEYRLMIKKSEFRQLFAPVESSDEAISFAMAMTSLSARFDLDPDDPVEFLVEAIEETHVEETPDGYLVYLFDSDRKMGCDIHSFQAVKVLVTREGQVQETDRQDIYRSYACFDFGRLSLEEDRP